MQYNTMPPVNLLNCQVLNLEHKTVYSLLLVYRPIKWHSYSNKFGSGNLCSTNLRIFDQLRHFTTRRLLFH